MLVELHFCGSQMKKKKLATRGGNAVVHDDEAALDLRASGPAVMLEGLASVVRFHERLTCGVIWGDLGGVSQPSETSQAKKSKHQDSTSFCQGGHARSKTAAG